jgi:hypothetical protein
MNPQKKNEASEDLPPEAINDLAAILNFPIQRKSNIMLKTTQV